MFKLMFLSLIFTPCCKYTYSKNNVKFLKLTSLELRQELLKLNRILLLQLVGLLDNHFRQFFM